MGNLGGVIVHFLERVVQPPEQVVQVPNQVAKLEVYLGQGNWLIQVAGCFYLELRIHIGDRAEGFARQPIAEKPGHKHQRQHRAEGRLG